MNYVPVCLPGEEPPVAREVPVAVLLEPYADLELMAALKCAGEKLSREWRESAMTLCSVCDPVFGPFTTVWIF